MTYCVAIAVQSGLVFCSDSRTNAGVDQVRTYSKMHTFSVDGERQLVLLSAGNLATTQGVVAQLKRADKSGAAFALIVGESELAAGTVMLKPLAGGGEQTSVPADALTETLAQRLRRTTQ